MSSHHSAKKRVRRKKGLLRRIKGNLRVRAGGNGIIYVLAALLSGLIAGIAILSFIE